MTFFSDKRINTVQVGVRIALKKMHASKLVRICTILLLAILVLYSVYSYRSWEHIDFSAGDTQVNFHRKNIHPFLAEYKRKVRFEDDQFRSQKMWLVPNHGGRTAINVYTSDEGVLLMDKDYLYLYTSGGTDAVIQNSVVANPEFARGYDTELHVTDWLSREEDEYYQNVVYVGRIDGTQGPLQFVSAEEDIERNFDYSSWE